MGSAIHVVVCTPLVTWPIGTSATARSGHSGCHMARATSPWRRETPIAARLVRSASARDGDGFALALVGEAAEPVEERAMLVEPLAELTEDRFDLLRRVRLRCRPRPACGW